MGDEQFYFNALFEHGAAMAVEIAIVDLLAL
jgi:hypothetical protein